MSLFIILIVVVGLSIIVVVVVVVVVVVISVHSRKTSLRDKLCYVPVIVSAVLLCMLLFQL